MDAPSLHVSNPPARPLMVFDGDCGFCRFWIERWRGATGDRVDYEPYQKVAERFPEIPVQVFENAVQFIDPHGRVSGGADAVMAALNHAPKAPSFLNLLWEIPGVQAVSRIAYGFVAGHRPFFSWVTRVFYAHRVEGPQYSVARWVFMRLLGLIYLVAFVSLYSQIIPLAGQHGIAPAVDFLRVVKHEAGTSAYRLVPSLCWFNASDGFLNALCVCGIALSCAVVLDFFPAVCLFLLWAVYLSLSSVCSPFFDFQWDILLLQTGFLAIFLVPPVMRTRTHAGNGGTRVARWLLYLLLFCLMFESGVVKLTSGDDCWRDMTALIYHYQTQPLPLWTSWYANQFPLWVQKTSVFLMFAAELVAPFCIFCPDPVRRIGAFAMILLQLCIAATGNYCFFNLLTIALCILLLDDHAWPRWCRDFVTSGLRKPAQSKGWPLLVVLPVAVIDLFLSGMQVTEALRPQTAWPGPMLGISSFFSPFRTFSGYGLFRQMTRTRPEIILEGSDDGQTWLPYEFKWKPGDVNRRPGLVAPFQPRLDWQMWFAALSDYRQNRWFFGLLQRLLEGSPEVCNLLESNPFPSAPPRYIRAGLYDYKFTTRGDATKAWWKREYLGLYCPVVSLQPDRKSPPAQ